MRRWRNFLLQKEALVGRDAAGVRVRDVLDTVVVLGAVDADRIPVVPAVPVSVPFRFPSPWETSAAPARSGTPPTITTTTSRISVTRPTRLTVRSGGLSLP
ncbi:MAG TPA: hypothetical protein VE198_10110 [Actinoallomurus sp.]|nr:hypothetical protein [Actinoallomurus sp.]